MSLLFRMERSSTQLLLLPLASLLFWFCKHEAAPSLFPNTSLVTPKFAASQQDRILNVHVVPHTHDDVGWLKTVEEYYYGFNSTIQRAHVQAILDSTVASLLRNPNRTFTYVEQKFFSMWWKEQTLETKSIVRQLVSEDRFTFVNGGWCMHDEATTHFMGMIDQTSLGHTFLKKEFDIVPTVGWQLDPFGHSATQASFMTSLMGFDALYFGRIDHQDLKLRQSTNACEGLWDSSPNVGLPVFWGLTGSFGGNYGPPRGFCFDAGCDDEPLVGLSEKHLLERILTLVQDFKMQSDMTKGNHIMLTMGEDFNYENAEVFMKNNDLMIHSVMAFQESKEIDVTAIFESKYDGINIFYSNPQYYTLQKYLETRRLLSDIGSREDIWDTKNDDFFPYADFDNGYWTGYFVSRSAFKRLERVASSFLMAARQIESFRLPSSESVGCTSVEPLFELEDAMGISQHHDAISGTAKQHVANDYSKKLSSGMNNASTFISSKMKAILLGKEAAESYLEDFGFCHLLNETICKVSEEASSQGRDIYVVVYNSLAYVRSAVVGIPVSLNGVYSVHRVDNMNAPVNVGITSIQRNARYVVYFETGDLPPTGAAAFQVTLHSDEMGTRPLTSLGRELKRDNPQLSNERIKIDFEDDFSFRLSDLSDGTAIEVIQRWGFYTSFDDKLDSPGTQNSGAYIFRPSEPNQTMTYISATRIEKKQVEDLVEEMHITYEVPWIKEVLRLFKNSPFLEVEYTVGPIPIDDGRGKEVVSAYLSDIKNEGVFYTDSNGREFQRRVRSRRPTWNLIETEPVAGNYYPVNAAIYIEDGAKSVSIVTDRSQGGSSLQDGCIELMVHRRTLRDDQRGVAEPLNETDGGVTPYPPYGDATRYGEGLIIRGKHRIIIGKGNAGAAISRLVMDQAFAEPLVFVGSAEHGNEVPFRADSFALIKQSLPENAMLITFKYLPFEPKKSYLIRLGHQYAANEDPELSKPVIVDLEALVGSSIVNCEEKTLSGNRSFNRWKLERLNWTDDSTHASSPFQCVAGNCTIVLHPMEIRTFQLQIE